MFTELTSLTAVEQRKVYDAIVSECRSTMLLDEHKIPYNMEAIIALSMCKIEQTSDHTKTFSIDWSRLEYLLTDAEYFGKLQMDVSSFPRGVTTYHLEDVDHDITISTVVEMDGTPMTERRLNNIVNTIYDSENRLLAANAKVLEIIKKHTNPAGMTNRQYVHQGAAILHLMRVELQITAQAVGSMDVMKRAQEDFSHLVTTRKIQNQVMEAFDIRREMLLQGTQLSAATVDRSLTNCLSDTMRTIFSIQSSKLPPTVNQQAYTEMINRIKAAAAQPSDNIVETVNHILSNLSENSLMLSKLQNREQAP